MDERTCIRDDVCFRPRARKQLPTRIFVALPDLAHGGAQDARLTTVESMARTGGYNEPCPPRVSLGDASYDRFDPVLVMPDVRHIVPPWPEGGASSRDIARSAPFRELLASGSTNRMLHDFNDNDLAWESAVSLVAGFGAVAC